MNPVVSRFQSNIPRFSLSGKAQDQLRKIAGAVGAASTTRVDACPIRFPEIDLDAFAGELVEIRRRIDNEAPVLIVNDFMTETVREFKSMVWALGALLGRPMVQNHFGHKIIEVYDRGEKTIEEGARYHQTKQGYYIHNDGVSDPLPIDYLVLACGQKARLGGESILVDVGELYTELVAYPDILKELQRDFCFENRGMSARDEIFSAPILSFSAQGIPLVRYFRVYIESAHRKANQPLTASQIAALDFLDTALDQGKVQRRVLLEPGEVLIFADDRILHTRTSFVDWAMPSDCIADNAALQALNRYMLRMWLKKE